MYLISRRLVMLGGKVKPWEFFSIEIIYNIKIGTFNNDYKCILQIAFN